MSMFKLVSKLKPAGDQPEAINALIDGLSNGKRNQTLLGVTGSGKTFTMANVIARFDRPVLVISHNKTLAAQLYSEFKAFFPENAVEYFISYYDYYLPESYIPQTDTYIAKDAAINEGIEKLRLATTASLLERKDVIVVASVSCIYGLGSPQDYADMCVTVAKGMRLDRNELLRQLVNIQYDRNDTAPEKGQFRVRGDTVDVFEPQRDQFIRINFWGDEIDSVSEGNIVTGKIKPQREKAVLFPCRHFVMPEERIELAIADIVKEMKERVEVFEKAGKLVEAQRLYQRVTYDVEMLREIGYCSGIENYSRYLSARKPGSRPSCLLDFFPENKIMIIDESHVTIPQLNAMYKGDRSRKQTLVDHGFRLPSALENRPLTFVEFEQLRGDTFFVSATPSEFELTQSGRPVEQIIRPTGLLDPPIVVRPLEGQIDDVMAEIRNAAAGKERVIITTLTKKNAERLGEYLQELGLKAAYLHSDLDALERIRVLNRLREGDFDCLIGINLLREGLDLPEVALIAILDADKEGFLRSEKALIQISGRAARNSNGRVILYADKITPAIAGLLKVTENRRRRQQAYNTAHKITPTSIVKTRHATIVDIVAAPAPVMYSCGDAAKEVFGVSESTAAYGSSTPLTENELAQLIAELEQEMLTAAEMLEFERAAELRDKIKSIAVKKTSETLDDSGKYSRRLT